MKTPLRGLTVIVGLCEALLSENVSIKGFIESLSSTLRFSLVRLRVIKGFLLDHSSSFDCDYRIVVLRYVFNS